MSSLAEKQDNAHFLIVQVQSFAAGGLKITLEPRTVFLVSSVLLGNLEETEVDITKFIQEEISEQCRDKR